ncbi:MAG: hypothetical protein OES47_01220 [Acidobacteriota bacterium]|nr:hypothetical protein [Acidobacteriota bacterium]
MSWTRLLASCCFAISLLVSASADAAFKPRKGADAWCGTDKSSPEQSRAAHRYHERRRARRFAAQVKRGELGTIAKTDVRKEGNIALLIDDDGRVIREQNLVDLSDLGLSFKYKKKQDGYLPQASGGGVAGDLGDELLLTDDDSVEIDLPFKVEVYGTKYRSLHVNSDGNVTFGEAEFASTERDVSRILAGPPRFSGFFRDLNPETATGDGGIYALVEPKSVKVTWLRVPEFDTNGINTVVNTFSITISKKGGVLFHYGELLSETAIVGLSPGSGAALELIDYTEELPQPLQLGAIAESFSDELSVSEPALAQVFLENFADRYSHIVVYADFFVRLLGSAGTIAYEQTIKNEIRGIGVPNFDAARFYGSGGALESFVMMGNLEQFLSDVEAPDFFGGAYSAADIMMHEIGHRWGVRLEFEKDGQSSEALLGRGGAHWSFCFNSENSYLEGSAIADNGDDTYTTMPGRAQYNPLDRYSIGLIGPEEVPDFFYVGGGCDGDRAPAFNVALSGPRVDVTIDDVVRALGARNPEAGKAPTKFNVAFVLLVRGGEEPQGGSVAKVNRLRKVAAARFKEAGGKIVTKLKLKK